MDLALYENIIMKRLAYFVTIGILVICLAVFAMIYVIKKMRQQDKALFFALIILCIALIIGSIILIGKVLFESIYDVSNQAYVVWDGEFIVGTDVENRSGTCSLYLPDENGIKLETDAYELKSGKYIGQVIYGEKTKIVLEIKTED